MFAFRIKLCHNPPTFGRPIGTISSQVCWAVQRFCQESGRNWELLDQNNMQFPNEHRIDDD